MQEHRKCLHCFDLR